MLSSGLLILGAGCATDQHADVDLYRAISDPPGELPVREQGVPLTLDEALRLTAAYNEQLGARGEEYVQALAERQRAASALRPTLGLFADAGLRENSSDDGIGQIDAGLTGQYRLLTGMGDVSNIDASDSRIRSRYWLILDLRETLLLETARAYYETLRAERLVGVLSSSVETQLARLDDARARNEAGLARPLDVSQIEAQVSRTRTSLLTAERQALEARATLSLLCNADLRKSTLSDGFEPHAEQRGTDELLGLAVHHRQDIVSARNEASRALALVEVAASQYSPAVTVNLDTFLLSVPDDSASSIISLLQLRMPLFSGGRIEAEVRSAWSVFRQRVLDYRLRVREARRDVETASAQLDSSLARVQELQTQVAIASMTLALAEASYQAGLGTNLERITAQDQLLTAELEAASEVYTTKIADLALRRACGLLSSGLLGSALPELSEEDRVVIESPALDAPRTPSMEGADR